MKHVEGEILILETGCYSDYSFQGPFKVLKDFESREEAEKHTTIYAFSVAEEDKDWDHASTNSFIAHLVTNGFIEEMGYVREHIGDYGDIEITA